MYYQYFGLTEAPFSIAVNPRYLFMSPRHRDALAHLLYGVGAGGGFILLTGEVGTGKTTINRCLLEQLPDDTDVAIILNPALNAMELLAAACDELGISYDQDKHTLKTLTDSLHRFLLDNHRRGRKTVLLIDEAQHLDFGVLEQIRLLTNLETNSEKLLQIILIGQPELAQMLGRPELRQLNQRITARYNLEPLSLEETGAYIRHRLQVAGMTAGRDVFPAAVVSGIHRHTRGIPRLINVLCDRILLGAYGRNQGQADQAMLRQAAREVMGEEVASEQGGILPVTWPLVLAGGVILIATLAWWLLSSDRLIAQWTNLVGAAAPSAQLEPAATRKPSVSEEPSAGERPSAGEGPATITEQHAVKKTAPSVSNTDTPANNNDPSAIALKPSVAGTGQSLAGSRQTGLVTDGAPLPVSGTAVVPAAPAQQAAPWLLPTSDALAQLWGLYSPEPQPADPCDERIHFSLACVEKSAATWDELGQFDRPLLLEMLTPARFTASVLFLGANSRTAWVASDTGVVPVGLAELGPLWTGKYHFFWHPPKGFHKPLRLGDKSAVVARVAALFARLDGQDQPLTGPRFNQALEQRVRLFQREHGIVADGVVGMQTLLKLNEALGIDLGATRAIGILQGDSTDGVAG
jgi:general secretion pathway protein A